MYEDSENTFIPKTNSHRKLPKPKVEPHVSNDDVKDITIEVSKKPKSTIRKARNKRFYYMATDALLEELTAVDRFKVNTDQFPMNL